ncbi:hypothetical protein K431DRAFT_199857, partial [Polychaeton citri CBS 116435]
YSYEVLADPDNIRLLSIMPGCSTQPLECSLTEVSLWEHPIFTALSYTWGMDSSWRSHFWILCNGKRLQVTANLYQCLIHLRASGVIEQMWVDSICVNQGNIPERNSQVRHMQVIYQTASRVIAWLG